MKSPLAACICLIGFYMCMSTIAFSSSMCEITSFVAEYQENSCQGEIITIEFDFNASDFGANGFTVEFNDGSQFYNIGDPYELFVISYCDEEIILTIIDNDDPNCTSTITLETACCDCAIEDPVIETSACTDGTFDINMDFFVNEGTCVNYEWYVVVEGIEYDLLWNNITQQFEAFEIEAIEEEIEISLCNNSPLNECWFYPILNPCFEEEPNCEITSFVAEYDETSCQGEIITIDFDFDATDFGGNGFTVEYNDGSQSFNLGDPYEIFMITLCNEDIELVIFDNDDPDCSAIFTLDPACCDCEISEPVIETSSCIDNTFNIEIEFFDNEGTCVNYEWYVLADGISYDLIWNSNFQQYEAFDLEASGEEFELMLCNDSPLNECWTYTLINPCFEEESNCEIISFVAEYDETSCEGEIITIDFDFDATDFGTNGFIVEYNGGSQFYNIGDSYELFVISYCDEEIILTIIDNDDPSCTSTTTLEPACCDCVIEDPVIETSACTNDTFDISMDYFLGNEGTCVNYEWYVVVEGIEYDLLWNNITQQFEAFGIEAIEEEIEISLCNNSPLNECWTYTLINPCFEEESNCEITSFVAEYDETSCEGEIIMIEFDFDATDFGANGFTVEYNDGIQSFNLGDPYEIYMITLCNEDIEMVISDNDDPSCSASFILGPACCDCEISEPVIETSSCTDNTFNIEIELFDNEGTCVNYEWYIVVDGVSYDLTWNSSFQQYEAFGIEASDEEFELMLCNDSPLNECWTYTLINPCFEEESNCEITSFVAEYDETSCDGEIIMIEFDFDATDFGANGFTVEYNDGIQSFNLGDPYEIYMITLCNENIELVISDNDDPDCSASFILGPACCDCEIEEPTFEFSACANGSFDIFFDFFNYEGTCVNYDWYLVVDSVNYDFAWNAGTQQFESFGVVAENEFFTLMLCNEGPLNECWTFTFTNPCFESEEDCLFNSFVAEYDEDSCDGELITIEFDFDASNFGSNGFTIEHNDGIENFNIGDPYEFTILSLCNEDVQLVIKDNDDPNCNAGLVLDPACCDCEISDPVVEISECNNGTFDLFISDFDQSGTCVNYNWYIVLDNNEYDLIWNPITLEYEAFGLSFFGVSSSYEICNDSPLNECWTFTLDNPCFAEEECMITNFTVFMDTISCDSNGTTLVQLDFDITDEGSQGYAILLDGSEIGIFDYPPGIEIIVDSQCGNPIEFSVHDVDDPSCESSSTLEVCCPDALTSSINSVNNELVSIQYLNGDLFIENKSDHTISLRFWNIAGANFANEKLVSKQTISKTKNELPPGIFIMQAFNAKGQHATYKLFNVGH